MPELPEVETVRQGLAPLIVAKTIKRVDIYYPKIITGDARQFAQRLAGQTFEKIDRYGKFLEFRLSNQLTVVSHLRMEGKYRVTAAAAPVTKHEHVRFIFTDDTALSYHDVRKFGRLQLVKTGTERSVTGIKKLGPEPNTTAFSVAYLQRELKKHSRNIKSTLLDQATVAGLGNIYVDETLWLSRIHPLTPANLISSYKVKQLHHAINEEIAMAISFHGTTVRSYQDANGHAGDFQSRLHVYGRAGMPCQRCGQILKKIKVGGRGTTFCPHCQKQVIEK